LTAATTKAHRSRVPGSGTHRLLVDHARGGRSLHGHFARIVCHISLGFAAPNLVWSQATGGEVDSFPAVVSMGLPHAFRPYAGVGLGFSRTDDVSPLARGMFGIHRDIGSPIPGVLGLAAEGWIDSGRDGVDGGARLMYAMAAIGAQFGVDYSIRQDRLDLALTLFLPLRRGGFLLPGSGLRLDWIPQRQSAMASLVFPMFQPWAGKTRPKSSQVPTPVEPSSFRPAIGQTRDDPEMRADVAALRHGVNWIGAFTLPYFPEQGPQQTLPMDTALAKHMAVTDRWAPEGHTPTAEVARYHTALDRAFTRAAGGSPFLADAADTARRTLLEEVLLPYNRTLGQIRSPSVLRGLARRSVDRFGRWVMAAPGQTAETQQAIIGVYQGLLTAVQDLADSTGRRWKDSRLVWLPFQLALRPDEHDTQGEIDALLERLIGRPFEEGHDVAIATDEVFVEVLDQSILDARDYHVLWIHDIRGRNDEGLPDSVAQSTVLDGYLQALTNAARRFDETRRVPTYLIFLDQYYYKSGLAERWLELLREPLTYEFRLGKHPGVERAVRAAQDSLRTAVAASTFLQREAARRGDDWLRRLFAVHVSVTNPPDPSFRSPGVEGLIPPGTPDDVMRDHRKIAFADLTEPDPSRGIAILTGLGVGEHYAASQWIDRTIILRGPGAVALKTEARAMLRRQGFRPEQIPSVLQPVARPPSYEHLVSRLAVEFDWTARGAIAMNATGYGPKRASVAKATLYTLMPPGSLIFIADPQWLSRHWGGMLLGSALRGCRLMLVGPGPKNTAFGGAFVQMSLQRELFLRLVQARDILADPIRQAGGGIHIGLWQTSIGTHQVAEAVLMMRDGLRRYPFIKETLSFDDDVWTVFETAATAVEIWGRFRVLFGYPPPSLATGYHPKWHLKAQFFASPEAMHGAFAQSEWRVFFAERIVERLLEAARRGTAIRLAMLHPITGYLERRTVAERERQVMYFIVGSHNMDLRSFMLDGEAIGIVAGAGSLVTAGDLLVLSAIGVEWLEDASAVDRNFPYPGKTRARAARALEALF
jgi:hypothetical protein